MTITQVGVPQPGIDALSILAPRVDPQTGQAFASELATSAHALQTASPSKESSLRGAGVTTRAHRDAAHASDARATADRADRADASSKADRAARADAADKADRADAADNADRADAADRSRRGAKTEAKSKVDRAAKADRKTDSSEDASESDEAPAVVAPVATAAQPVAVLEMNSAAAEAGALKVDGESSVVTAEATALIANEVSSQEVALETTTAATTTAGLTPMVEEALASVTQAELPDAKVKATDVKVEATDVKVEATDVKVEVASTNVPADAATDAGDQSAAQFDVALQQVPAAVQTNVVAGAAAQGAFEDSMPDTAPTSVTSSTNVTSAAQPAATMPTVSDTGRSAATAAPAPVATQLAAHLSNFRGRADGSYETTLTLHPADLGKVSIRIEVLNGTVAIHAMGAQAATVDALRDAMPQLQQELSDAGLNLIGSQVSQQSGQGDQSAERTPAQESAPRISSTLSTSDRSSEVDSSASSGILGRDGRVDVRV